MSNIINLNRVWILVKPTTLNYYANDLRNILTENGFVVDEKKSSNHFLEISDEIYQKASVFSPMHRAINMYLLGEKSNYCEVWFLKQVEELDIISSFEKLGQMKREFRKNHCIEGLHIEVEYKGIKSKFGFGFFHVPDPNREDITRESNIVKKYFI